MLHFDWIARHASRTPEKLAQVDLATGREYTYRQMNERANRFANFLRNEFGLAKGDRLSIMGKNSSEYFEVLFACSKIGVILNTLNWRLAVPELRFILEDCAPRALIYDPEFAEPVSALLGHLRIEHLVVVGESDQGDGWAYERALQAGSPSDPRAPELPYDSPWCILYTSGTTGRPKGAMVTYGNFFYNAVGMGQAIRLTSDDVNLVTLPTFHAGGLGLYAGPTFHFGGTVLVMRDFDPVAMMETIERYRVTSIILVPPMYLMLRQHSEYGGYDLSSVRVWSSGGSPLPTAVIEAYQQDGIVIQQGMGMTETGPTVFIISKEDALRKAGSVGKPVLHTDVCIMDRDGQMLGPNAVGELCIRGNITTGYWNNPEKTAETIRDGWLHSGDAARCDDEGFYYLVDRWKDMYISGGENVYPAEVENVLFRHDAVQEVAVIGVPHPKWQESGRAIVALKPGKDVGEADLIAFCRENLAKFKVPKSVVFVEALPRNDIGKVVKKDLKNMFGEPIA